MRLAGQIKQGFYPIAPETVRLWAQHIQVEDPARTSLLDPCCGKGDALATLQEALDIPARNVFAIELDEGRAKEARERLKGATVLGPADFHGAAIAPCLSIVWLNPPFDDEMGGGGREEVSFLNRATMIVPAKGLLALVIPENQLNYRVQSHLSEHYTDIVVFEPPAELRPFKEIIITAKRAEKKVYTNPDWDGVPLVTSTATWSVPPRKIFRPRVFAKGGPTELEILAMLEQSPANQIFAPPIPLPPARPLLPLSTGHASLVVASGQVDGVIRPPGEEPHVVRGTTKKENVLASVEAGESSTTAVYREKMVPMVRTIGMDGIIRTFV